MGAGDTAIGEAGGAADTEMEEPSAPALAALSDLAGSEAAKESHKPAAAIGSAANGAPAEVNGASAVSLDGPIPAEKLRVAAATALAAAAVRHCLYCFKPGKSVVMGLHTHMQSTCPKMVAAGPLHASAWNCPLELHMLLVGNTLSPRFKLLVICCGCLCEHLMSK